MGVSARLDRIDQPVEAVKSSIYHFQRLLSNVGIEELIVLIPFAQMVCRLIAQVLVFLKIVLPNSVKPYIVEIFALVGTILAEPETQSYSDLGFGSFESGT